MEKKSKISKLEDEIRELEKKRDKLIDELFSTANIISFDDFVDMYARRSIKKLLKENE